MEVQHYKLWQNGCPQSRPNPFNIGRIPYAYRI